MNTRFDNIMKSRSRTLKASIRRMAARTACLPALAVYLATLGLGLSANAQETLDQLLTYAAKQPAANVVTVSFAMTTNDPTKSNRVTYAVGILTYNRGNIAVPPSFSSASNGVTQYFSDRTYKCGTPLLSPSAPFDCNNTDLLTIVISKPGEVFPPQPYSLSVQSKSGNQSFVPKTDSTTSALTGVLGSAFVTISLCNQKSQPPPPPPPK